MGKKRRDEEPDGVWIGKTDAAPERKPPADAEAKGSDAAEEAETHDGAEEAETHDGGRTAERRRNED